MSSLCVCVCLCVCVWGGGGYDKGTSMQYKLDTWVYNDTFSDNGSIKSQTK